MSFECEFCKKEFSTKSNLSLHKKTTKKCLKIQADLNNIIPISKFSCEYCNKKFSIKHNYEVHKETCKEKDIVKYEDIKNKYEELLKKHEELKIELAECKVKLELNECKIKLECKDEEIKRLEKLAKKPTTMTNNYNNCNNKIELNVAFEKLTPFTKENIISSLRQYLSPASLKEGENSFSSELNNSLEDKVIVTDMSRGKAIVKLESGDKKNTTSKKVIKDVFKYGKDVILENCEIALEELQENKHHNFNKSYCEQTNYIHKVKNTVKESIKNKNTDITTNLSNKLDLILE
jgi:hypothetical protein